MQYHRAFITFLLLLFAASPRGVVAQTGAPPVHTPQQIARLQNFGMLCAFLNLASGTVRLVVLMNPASPSCEVSLDAVQSVLNTSSSNRLRAYIVMSKITEADTEMRVAYLATRIKDRRAVFFSDPGAVAANAFRAVVGSGDIPATGVFLLYDTAARMALEPPLPSIWMSANPQIKGRALDTKLLGDQAIVMVRRLEEKMSDAATPKQ
jgi:hypothetical protein